MTGEINGASREPCIWKILRKFHKLSPEGFPDSPKKDNIFNTKVPFTKAQLADEINKMQHLLGQHNNRKENIVLSHNDLLLGNIVYQRDSE